MWNGDWEGPTLDGVVQEGFSEEVTFDLPSTWVEETSHLTLYGKDILGRRQSKCKGLEVSTNLDGGKMLWLDCHEWEA